MYSSWTISVRGKVWLRLLPADMPENKDYARLISFDNGKKELIIYQVMNKRNLITTTVNFQEVLTDVGGVIWDSALMTIHYFFKNPKQFEGKKVN